MDDKVGESGKKWSILTKGARRPGMLFRGQSYRSLDAKGRLMLPRSFGMRWRRLRRTVRLC